MDIKVKRAELRGAVLKEAPAFTLRIAGPRGDRAGPYHHNNRPCFNSSA